MADNLNASMKRLHKEVIAVKNECFPLKIDNAFVLWFAEAYLVGDRRRAVDGIIGGPGDKTIDAVYVDEPNRIIQLVQGKYSQAYANHDSEVYDFAQRAHDFRNADFAEELESAGPAAKKALMKAHAILNRAGDFKLKMYFATTGKITPQCDKKAKKIAAHAGNTELEVLDRSAILALFQRWRITNQLPLPKLDILVHGPHTLSHSDVHNKLQGWIFTTTSQEVIRLFKTADERLFARNVRGYLGGDSSINTEIVKTAKDVPERFWVLNNGITIIADHVEKIDSGKQTRMLMLNPQVVNGQQTVRALAKSGPNQSRVLVRLIRLEKALAQDGFGGLVGDVVRATNRQNAIKPADLMSNDAEQVRIEREFRKQNYAYERRRQDPKELNEKAAKCKKIKREELANALSATRLGAHTVRRSEQWESKYNRLFNEKYAVSDYLARWWAARQVWITITAAVPEARWVVLESLWGWSDLPLSKLLKSEMNRRAFVQACQEEKSAVLGQLRIAAKQLYLAARPVYLEEKKRYGVTAKLAGKPFKVLSPDAFFRREAVTEAVSKAARRTVSRKHKITSALK